MWREDSRASARDCRDMLIISRLVGIEAGPVPIVMRQPKQEGTEGLDLPSRPTTRSLLQGRSVIHQTIRSPKVRRSDPNRKEELPSPVRQRRWLGSVLGRTWGSSRTSRGGCIHQHPYEIFRSSLETRERSSTRLDLPAGRLGGAQKRGLRASYRHETSGWQSLSFIGSFP